MRFGNLLRFRYYRKIVVTYFVIGLIVIGTSIIGMSYTFSSMVTRQVGAISLAALETSATAFESILANSQKECETLIIHNKFRSVAEGRKVSQIDEFELMQEIYKITSTDSNIKYMGVYNGRLNRYVGTRGIYYDSSEELKEFLPENARFTLVSRMVREYENTEKSAKSRVLTYTYQPYNYRQAGSAVILDIDYAILSDLFTANRETEQLVSFFVNGDDQVVFTAPEMTDADQGMYQELISRADLDSTNYSVIRNGFFAPRYLVSTYVIRNTPWKLVSVQDFDYIAGNFSDLRNILVLIMLAVVAAYIALSIYFSRYIYKPVRSFWEELEEKPLETENKEELQDEFERMESLVEKYQIYQNAQRWNRTSDSLFLHQCIHSTREVPIKEYNAPIIEYLNSGGSYCIAVMEIKDPSDFHISREDSHTTCFVIAPLINDSMNQNQISSVCFVENEELILLCKIGDNTQDILEIAFEELILRAQRELGIEIQIGCSDVLSGTEQVQEGYLTAKQALMQGLMIPSENIFYYSKQAFNDKSEYPAYLEKKIIKDIVLKDMSLVEEHTAEFFAIAQKSKEAMRSVYHIERLFLSVLSYGESVNADGLYEFWKKRNYFRRISFDYSLEELKRRFLSLCQAIIESGNRALEGASNDPVIIATEYMEEHYDQANLSLTYLADLVHLTPAYLGQLFIKAMGCNCNEYLLRIRMEKACELLTETDLSINEISEKVGILNHNYFFTLFKKAYGVTPLKYRTSKKNN